MKHVLIIGLLFLWGCGQEDSKTKEVKLSPIVNLEGDQWFSDLLKLVDDVAGPRMQYMQMGGMETASYQTDATVSEVVSVIGPSLKSKGFALDDSDAMKEGMRQAEKHMADNMKMKIEMGETAMYAHENGDRITVMRMTIDLKTDDMEMHMTMLTVQLINPDALGEK